jgi:hypothetical protein
MTATLKNEYGELIHIKVDGEILIHHEDASEDYLPLDVFFKTVILSEYEKWQIFNRSMLLISELQQQNVKVISELEKIRDKASNFWQEHINKLNNV